MIIFCTLAGILLTFNTIILLNVLAIIVKYIPVISAEVEFIQSFTSKTKAKEVADILEKELRKKL